MKHPAFSAEEYGRFIEMTGFKRRNVEAASETDVVIQYVGLSTWLNLPLC